jgi:nicotinamide riboside kinase
LASNLRALYIALLGAESTGKTQLAHALAARLQEGGRSAIAVDEYLREWCDQHGRTPHADEQAAIAKTQQDRIEAAAAQADCVIADTTPLMTAIYSEFIFADDSLTQAALAYQSRFDLTLVTGLDMPWQADGIQRDGEHVRSPVDALLREKLQSAGIEYEVIYGVGEQRTEHAFAAIMRHLNQNQNATDSIAPPADNTPASSLKDPKNTEKKWVWQCDKCSDSDCEHRLFTSLIDQKIML